MDSAQSPSLLESAPRGDHEAFNLLYERHARLVNGYATSILRDRAEAEDVAQEVFVQAWIQADRFDPLRGKYVAWLLTIARTRALDRLRRRACRPGTSPGVGVVDSSIRPVAELSLVVRDALDELLPERRLALELAYYEGLSQTEIAALMGRPLGTVKTWIRRGLFDLRRTLAPLDRAGEGHTS